MLIAIPQVVFSKFPINIPMRLVQLGYGGMIIFNNLFFTIYQRVALKDQSLFLTKK